MSASPSDNQHTVSQPLAAAPAWRERAAMRGDHRDALVESSAELQRIAKALHARRQGELHAAVGEQGKPVLDQLAIERDMSGVVGIEAHHVG